MERRSVYDYRDTKVSALERAETYNVSTGDGYSNYCFVTYKYTSQYISIKQGYKISKYISGIGWNELPIVWYSSINLKSGHTQTMRIDIPGQYSKSDGVYKVSIICTNKIGNHESNVLWIVQDREGNLYNTAVFGQYRLTIEPLRTQISSNGRSIMQEEGVYWKDITTPFKGIIYTSNVASESPSYPGTLKKGICPECCYIPNDEVLNSIRSYIEMNNIKALDYPDMGNNNFVMTCTCPNESPWIHQWSLRVNNNDLQLVSEASSSIHVRTSPLDALVYCVVTEVPDNPLFIKNVEISTVEWAGEDDYWDVVSAADIHIEKSLFDNWPIDYYDDIMVDIYKLQSSTNEWVEYSLGNVDWFSIRKDRNSEIIIENESLGNIAFECEEVNTLYRFYAYYNSPLYGKVRSDYFYLVKDAQGHSYICKRIGNYIVSTEYLYNTITPSGIPIMSNNYKPSDYNYALLYTRTLPTNLIPTGFHIPSKEEWEEIFTVAGCKNNAVKASPKTINSHRYLNNTTPNAMGNSHNAEIGLSELNLYPLGNWYNNDDHRYSKGEDANTYLATSTYHGSNIIYAYTLNSTIENLVAEPQLLGQTFAIRFCKSIEGLV